MKQLTARERSAATKRAVINTICSAIGHREVFSRCVICAASRAITTHENGAATRSSGDSIRIKSRGTITILYTAPNELLHHRRSTRAKDNQHLAAAAAQMGPFEWMTQSDCHAHRRQRKQILANNVFVVVVVLVKSTYRIGHHRRWTRALGRCLAVATRGRL